MQVPALVLNTTTKREHGRKAQLANVAAARAVSDIVRTTLGPRSMLKMILDPMGGIVLSNDGNSILREVDVAHPAAKSMIELSRTQDEEVGDGTTSVIILAGELLRVAEPFLRRNMHPRVIVTAYNQALDEGLKVLDAYATKVDLSDRKQALQVVRSCLGTKFVSRFGDMVSNMALDAVQKVAIQHGSKVVEVDIKRYIRIEKIPGDMLTDCRVLDGLMINKDVVDSKMARRIQQPRIVLLDCPLEYKKGESQTAIEFTKEEDFEAFLEQERTHIEKMCAGILSVKPDLVFTEKGCSDLCAYILFKAGVSVIRRVRKTDNNRIARATGATVLHDPADLTDKHVGTGCGLFEVRKIGDDYFTHLVQCENPKACTVVLRGASKDVLNEIERNLFDAMNVVRNLVYDPRVLPGGGAIEMAVSHYLSSRSTQGGSSVDLSGKKALPFRAVGEALEVVPRTLLSNCGASLLRVLTKMRAEYARNLPELEKAVKAVEKARQDALNAMLEARENNDQGKGGESKTSESEGGLVTWNKSDKDDEKTKVFSVCKSEDGLCRLAINGTSGEVQDADEVGVWDTYLVKAQTLKTAIESACMLLRIDDIVSGSKSQRGQ